MSKSYLDKQLPISGVFVKDPSNMGEFPLIQSKDIILSSIDGTQPDYRLDKIIQVTPETGAVKIATQLNPETGDVADGATPIEVPTKTSQLTNDSSFVSGPLKTINGQSLLGEGNISVQGGSSTEYELPIATTEQLGGIKPDGTTIVVNQQGVATAVAPEVDAYTKEDADNKFATKEFVQEEIDSAIAGSEVDLSNYYNKTEADSTFATKAEFNKHINEYESKVNQNISSINDILTDHTRDINSINNSISQLDDKIEAVETTVYTPDVSDEGILSWTNNGGLANPEPVNIKGPQGPEGPQGPVGPQGPEGGSGPSGASIQTVTIETSPTELDANGKNHFGELKWTNTNTETKYSEASVIIEPEFKKDNISVVSTDASIPTVEIDPTSEIELGENQNGAPYFKPQYTMVLKDIAPKMFVKEGGVNYVVGGKAAVGVEKRATTNEYDISMNIPVPKGVANIPVTYNGDDASTSVTVQSDAEGRPEIKIALDSPIKIAGATATMENMTDKTINVTVTQVGNKATFNFAFPNILDDGELV